MKKVIKRKKSEKPTKKEEKKEKENQIEIVWLTFPGLPSEHSKLAINMNSVDLVCFKMQLPSYIEIKWRKIIIGKYFRSKGSWLENLVCYTDWLSPIW